MNYLNNSLSRGLRNNNPGNIRRTSIAWQGKIPFAQSKDADFEQFYTMEWGLRALMVDLRSKINSGNNTIAKIITKYAPPTENNTASYINTVSQVTGIGANVVLSPVKQNLITLAKGIVRVELGGTFSEKITNSVLSDAYKLIEDNASFTGGAVAAEYDLNEVVIDASTAKKCSFCGEIIAGVVLFFFTYLSVVVL